MPARHVSPRRRLRIPLSVRLATATLVVGSAALVPVAQAEVGAADAQDGSAQADTFVPLTAAQASQVRLAQQSYQSDQAFNNRHVRLIEARTAAKEAAKKAAERAKKAAEDAKKQRAAAVARASARDPRTAAAALVAAKGWPASQFTCLDKLWTKESNWKVNADNPSSSAYGIPQALPGTKMASHGADWKTNPVTQIKWGLAYISDSYGTPCAAWSHSQSRNWY